MSKRSIRHANESTELRQTDPAVVPGHADSALGEVLAAISAATSAAKLKQWNFTPRTVVVGPGQSVTVKLIGPLGEEEGLSGPSHRQIDRRIELFGLDSISEAAADVIDAARHAESRQRSIIVGCSGDDCGGEPPCEISIST